MTTSIDHTFQRARAALQAGKFNDAEHTFKAVLQAQPRHVAALNLLSIVLTQLGKLKEAEDYVLRALKENATSDATFYNYGIILKALKRPTEALERFSQALAINAAVPETWNNRGTVFNDLRRFREAIADFDRAISINSNSPGAFCNKGKSLAELKLYDQSLSAFNRALSLKPDLAEAWFGRGSIFTELKQYDDAFAAYDRALSLKPNFAEVWSGRGNIFSKLKRYDDAFTAYDKALSLKQDLTEAWLGRGNVFTELNEYNDALVAYDKALSLKPDLAEAWLGRGIILTELMQYDDAFAAYDRALSLKPDLADAWLGRGAIYSKRQQYGDAVSAYDRALAINSDLKYVEGSRLQAKQIMCDWTALGAEASHLLLAVRAGKPASFPLTLLSIASSPADQLQCAQLLVADKYPAMPPIWRGERYAHDRIRIAYLSTDYRQHAIAYLISEVLELHDRTKFEVVGISLGPDDKSDMRSRMVKSFDQFHDVRSQSDHEVAELIKRLEIDIAVDLNNYSDMCRPGILAYRAAPIQASYLGYPSTMGADFIDYAIADKFVLPSEQQIYWTEKFVYMPDSYLVHDTRTKRNMPLQPPTRAEAGLPDQAFVFCCFNNSFKITPAVFQIWMRLLKAVEGSVVWFSSAAEPARLNLREEAKRADVDPERLIFAPKLDRIEDHLSRHRTADLFLDTLLYNAHTTAADALWAGLPVVTCTGKTFPARVAGSLLHAIGLPELVTETLQDYEALALQLACDPARLAGIKAKLARNRDTHSLFDTARFTRHLEAAYVSMVERHQRGEPPVPFAVTPID